MSCFGEISEPSTRTAWEDWDDLSLRESYPELCFLKNVEASTEINTLLILEGGYFYDCVKAQHDLEHVNSIQEVNLHLYKTMTSDYICIIKDYNLVQSSEILELLKDYITNSKDVIAILTKPIVEYQVSQLDTNEYVLRSVFTSKQIPRGLKSSIKHLEQPNIISGVTAGAICLREIMDKPAAALVCYIEYQEEQQIHELQELLSKYRINMQTDKIKRNTLLNSNLYI